MDKNKIIAIASVVIIIIGIIVALTAGFNAEMMIKEHKQVQLNLGKEYNMADVKQITDEVLKGQTVELQKVEVYEKQVLISTNDITDEQKTNLVTKINEKFGTDIKNENVQIIIVPNAKLADIINPYFMSFAIVTLIIAIYVAFRFRKLGTLKAVAQIVLGLALAELVVMSILAIVRIPVGRNLPSIIFVTYGIATFVIVNKFENELQKLKEEAEKNKKKKTTTKTAKTTKKKAE